MPFQGARGQTDITVQKFGVEDRARDVPLQKATGPGAKPTFVHLQKMAGMIEGRQSRYPERPAISVFRQRREEGQKPSIRRDLAVEMKNKGLLKNHLIVETSSGSVLAAHQTVKQ